MGYAFEGSVISHFQCLVLGTVREGLHAHRFVYIVVLINIR